MDLKTFTTKYHGRPFVLIEDMMGEHQRKAIETLLYTDGMPYGMMSIEALGRVVGMDMLTYKQAILMMKAGMAMRNRHRERQRLANETS